MACLCSHAGMTGDGARWCSVAWQSTGRNFDNKTRARRCARRRVVAKKLIITLQLGRLSLSRGNLWWCAPHGNVIFWHFASKRPAFKGFTKDASLPLPA